jgi:hypothetical protein
MTRPSLQIVAGGAEAAQGKRSSHNASLQLVPPALCPPSQQLVLTGLLRRKETLISVGLLDLDYSAFLTLLKTYGVRKVLDVRKVRCFGDRGFPSTWAFQEQMAQLGVHYEYQDKVRKELPSEKGKARYMFANNDIWMLTNREVVYNAVVSEELLLARYAATLLRERVGLTLVRDRLGQGPLLLLGDSTPPPKKTEQDVIAETLCLAFPDFEFDLIVYPRNNQWYPWMELGESPR